ncbi:MAG: hypothetical protein QOJ99_3970 [Bryobacterales bacterium]|nr:hypothetical protein [Bryobacterales bacterium]
MMAKTYATGASVRSPELEPEVAHFRHCVQFYETDAFLAGSVSRFAAEGLARNEAVIVIATCCHLPLIETHMYGLGRPDFEKARTGGQFTMFSAEETLAGFMVNGMPDDGLFMTAMHELMRAVEHSGPWSHVRVFGEMVAVLLELVSQQAALRLEYLWDALAQSHEFSLMCGYPARGFNHAGGSDGFARICNRHSHVLPAESYLSLAHESDRLRAVAGLQQIAGSSKAELEHSIFHHQHHDPLTDLPNQKLLTEILASAVSCSPAGALIAVFAIDLDGCKVIGDAFGRGARDRLVIEAAQRLRVLIGAGGTLARTGSQEFTLVACGLPDPEAAALLAQTALSALSLPFAIAGRELVVYASLGISMSPVHGTESETLLRRAEIALMDTKQKGRGQMAVFSATLGRAARLRERVEARLRQADARCEFEIHFQPLICMATARPSRYEALLRWDLTPGCSAPPATFIPIMEETGLIVPIGEWVLHQACMKAAAWQNGSLRGRGVAVNVSAVQFARPDFVSLVARTLEKTGLRPELLELELTESLLIGDFEKSKRALAELKGMGVTVAIDDFGTGYSCLAYLHHLAIDALKIDKCFVSGIEQSKSKAAVFRGLAGIAHELSIRIIAEGVETPNQYRAVAEFGCHEAQGFLLGRPGPEISPHSPLLIRPNQTARRHDAGKKRFPLSCHTSAMEERQ